MGGWPEPSAPYLHPVMSPPGLRRHPPSFLHPGSIGLDKMHSYTQPFPHPSPTLTWCSHAYRQPHTHPHSPPTPTGRPQLRPPHPLRVCARARHPGRGGWRPFADWGGGGPARSAGSAGSCRTYALLVKNVLNLKPSQSAVQPSARTGGVWFLSQPHIPPRNPRTLTLSFTSPLNLLA